MDNQDIYEQFYQSWIKQHLKAILSIAAFLVLAAGIWEANHYYRGQQQMSAQILFENYLSSPKEEIVNRLQSEYPYYIQTHLVLLMDAKDHFETENYTQAIEKLSFVTEHANDEGLQHLAAYRLSMIYRELDQVEQARAVIENLENPDGYAKLQQALSLPTQSTERMEQLQTAFNESSSRYVSELITIAQNDNITS